MAVRRLWVSRSADDCATTGKAATVALIQLGVTVYGPFTAKNNYVDMTALTAVFYWRKLPRRQCLLW